MDAFQSDTFCMITRNGIRKFVYAALLILGAAAHADKSSQFSFVYGLSVPDYDNTKVFHLMGVKGQAFIAPVFSFGGYFYLSDSAGQKSSTEKFNFGLYGVEAAYHIPASTGDTFVALRMGMTKVGMSPGGADMTFSPYHYGIASGYDHYITEKFGIGFEGSYLHVLPGRTDLNGTSYEQKSFNIINFLITAQIRL